MSSDSKDKNADSSDPAPGRHGGLPSARAPTTWGPVRSALASLYNLEVLLRNRAISLGTLVDLLPELCANAALLRDTFRVEAHADVERLAVSERGNKVLAELDSVLDGVQAGATDRDSLAARAGTVADELEASADLSALLDRSNLPNPTEVSLAVVAREAGRMHGAGRGRSRVVRFDGGPSPASVVTDPVVLATLLSLIIACVYEGGTHDIVVRAQPLPKPGFVVEAVADTDLDLPTMTMGILAWVPAAAAVARRVAANLGAVLELEGARAMIELGKPGRSPG
jgi:hypothetical protein